MGAGRSEDKTDDLSVNECFTKTMSLDGETNLKPKMAMKQIDNLMNSNKIPYEAKKGSLNSIKFNGGPPEADLYSFKGEVSFQNEKSETVTQDLDLKQFLHRGTIVVNSHYIDGMVLYTGKETKIVLNQGKYNFKQSQLDQAINWITLWNMIMIFVLALIMTLNSRAFL